MFEDLDEYLFKDLLEEFVDCKSLLALSLTSRKYHDLINHDGGVCDELLFRISPLLTNYKRNEEDQQPIPRSLLPKLHPIAFYQEIRRAQKQFLVSCGEDHTIIAVSSRNDQNYDKILTFGGGTRGQLGNGGEEDSAQAKEILIPDEDFANRKTFVKSVVGGFDHTVVLLENGKLYGFGSNLSGQLSAIMQVTEFTIPTRIPFPKVRISMISCAKEYSAFVLKDSVGTVIITGNDVPFQTERYDEDYKVRVLVRGQIKNFETVTDVSAGYHHLLMITDRGNAYSAGRNDAGQLGIGPKFADSASPRWIKLGEPIAQVAAGENHSLMLTRDGSLFSCGDGSKGQLGNGYYDPVFFPQEVKLPEGCFPIIITCGTNHSVVLDLDGKVLTCGNNAFGQTAARSNFFAVSRFSAVTAGEFNDQEKIFRKLVHIAAGNNHTAALGMFGNLYMFGQTEKCGGGGFIRRHSHRIDPVKVDLEGGIDFNLLESNKTVFFTERYVRSRR